MENMRIMLDTSGYSAFLRGNAQIELLIRKADEILINPVIAGELLAGFSMGKSEEKNRAMFEEFCSSPRVGFVDIDEETSQRYAAILRHLREKGTPIPTNDLWIAASAMQYGLNVVTTDHHYLEVDQILATCIET